LGAFNTKLPDLTSTYIRCSSRICSQTSSLRLIHHDSQYCRTSNSAVNLHLCADDTQLFLSVSTADFTNIVCLLEQTICNVYNWMSSNFLSLNPSKTEFLLVGLPQQLSKLSNPMIHLPNNITLSPIYSAPNLGVIFDSNLTFSKHISTVSKSCFYYIRDLNILLIILQPVLLLLLSFILNLTILHFSSTESSFYSN
jgi:hypothetical protein